MNTRTRTLILLLISILLIGSANATFAQVGTRDWGDAPEDGEIYRYPTTAESDGAHHDISDVFYLGQSAEGDDDGIPDLNALGDDLIDGTDDEDGVYFASPIRAATTTSLSVIANEDGFFNLWIDYNGDGDWDDPFEHVFRDELIIIGTSMLSWVVPSDTMDGTSYARVRFTGEELIPNISAPYYAGYGGEGEVEDYKVRLDPSRTDRFEPNNSSEEAFDLGALNQERGGLTLNGRSDHDWFEWTALHDDDSAEINLNLNGDGNAARVRIYDSAGEIVGEEIVENGSASVQFTAFADSKYQIQVQSLTGLIDDYKISIWPGLLCKNYAVLFAGGGSGGSNYTRYYDNIKKLYETLVDQYNIPPSNIYILYADGTNPAADLSTINGLINSNMTYATNEGANVMAGTRPNLEQVLTVDLKNKVDSNDRVLFYAFDHGGGSTNAATTGEEYLVGYGDQASDNDVNTWLNALNYGRLTSVHAQCFAGGMIDDALPTGSKHYAMAATNHYEYSWGDGFADAFANALIAGKSNTQDAYEYAHDNDPYAVARGTYPDNGGSYGYGTEHPWSSGFDFPIFCSNTNLKWWMDIAEEHRWVPPWDEVMVLTFDQLAAKIHTWSPDTDALHFRVEQVMMGEVFVNGRPVEPGETTIGLGDVLSWQPEIGRTIRSGETVYPFTLRATDGAAVSDNAVAMPIEYYEEGSSPLNAVDDEFEVSEDKRLAVLDVLDNDESESGMMLRAVGQPRHGAAAIRDGQLVYSPSPNFNGVDQFSYTVVDRNLESDTALVKVTVVPDNDLPVLIPDDVTVIRDGSAIAISPLLNDLDDDNDILSARLAPSRRTTNGTVIDNGDNTFTYTPDSGFDGTDSFDYIANDGSADVMGTVNINVTTDDSLDWGDAPQFEPQYGSGYRTTLDRDGARHTIGGPWLGDSNDAPDGDGDGNPEANAQGDNASVSDDENGFTQDNAFVVGNQTTINVEVNGVASTAVVQVWIDWDGNLQWEADEMMVNAPYANGTHAITIDVPIDAVIGDTFARFRISSAGGLGSSGAAADGEVEDHQITVYQATPTAVSVDGMTVNNRTLLPLIIVTALLLLAAMTVTQRIRFQAINR